MDITNKYGVSLPAAIWLLHDEYEYFDDPKYISATTLLKPIKQIVLAKRVPNNLKVMDLTDFMNVRYGTAVHDSTEVSMRRGLKAGMAKLGFSDADIQRLVINPTPEQMEKPGIVPIWVENRVFKKVLGYTVGGKYDLIFDGAIRDWKTAKVFSWIKGNNDEKFQRQLSIYRWLNPDKVTEDTGYIDHFFKDWMAGDAAKNPRYPQAPIIEKAYLLHPLIEVQQWVEDRLRLIDTFQNRDEKHMPDCTPDDLWMSPPVFKYYPDPAKTDGRATRSFDVATEAYEFQKSKGKGVVIPIQSEAKACNYCNAAPVCKQRESLFK